MKKLVYLFIAIFMGAHSLYAQDCATGYCPATITVHHKAGDLSASTGDITYRVDAIGSNCWLGQNLGATSSSPSTGYSWATMGWYFQWGSKKAYDSSNLSGILSTYTNAATTWPANSDPCTLLLGSAWHVPTATEASNMTATVMGNTPTAGTTGISASYQYRAAQSSLYTNYYNSGGILVSSMSIAGLLWQGNNAASYDAQTTLLYASATQPSATWQYIYKCDGLPVRCVKLKSN